MRAFRWHSIICIATSACFGAAQGVADDRTEAEDEYPLPEIVVRAQRLPAYSPTIVREVTREDIHAWNAHNAAEALVQTPGVNVQYGGSSGDARVWMRGFRHRDVLILFDGIPIASAFEGTIDLNEISLDNVSSVKVMKGAPSVLYGTNGLGGVIDFVPTRRFDDSSVVGTVELGEEDTRLFKLGYAGQSDALRYLFAGAYGESDGYQVSDDFTPAFGQDNGLRNNSDYRRANFSSYLAREHRFGDTSLFVNLSDNQKGLPTEVSDDPDFERLTRSRRRTIGLSHAAANLPVAAKFFYNSYDSELKVYTDATFTELDEIEEAEDYSYGGMVYSTIRLSPSSSLLISADGKRDTFEGDGAFDDFDKASLDTYSAAAETQALLGERWSVALGGIFSYFDQREDNRDRTVFNPQAVVGYQLTNALSLHASAAQRTRFPKLRELYLRRRGNPLLDKETAENFDLGLKYRHANGATSDLSVFYSDVQGLIERPDRDTPYQNLDNIEFKGVEAATGGWITERWFTRLAYTYLDAGEKLPDGTERQLRSRAKHSGYVELRHRFPRAVDLYLNGIYSRGLYDLDSDQNHVELPDYFVLHAKVVKTFTDSVSLYVSVSNVFDEDYEHRLGFPREGRAYFLGATFRR